MSNDLNTSRSDRLTVALTGIHAAVLAVTVAKPRRMAIAASGALGALLVWRNRRFLGFLRRCRSWAFAVRSAPLLWIHHLSAAVAAAWALATWPIGDRRM